MAACFAPFASRLCGSPPKKRAVSKTRCPSKEVEAYHAKLQAHRESSVKNPDTSHAVKVTSATSWWQLALRAGLAWCFLLFVDEYVISISMDGRSWSLLCCMLLTIYLSTDHPVTHAPPTERAPSKELEQASVAQLDAFNVFMSGMQAKLDVLDKVQDAPWVDCSKKVAKVFLCFLKDKKPNRILVTMDFQIREQVKGLPLVDACGGKIRGGVMPIFTAARHFGSWLPFCHSTECLARFGPCKEIWLLKFKIAFITAEVVIGLSVEDRLDTSDCIDILLASPEEGMEGKPWFGVTIPPVSSTVRVPITAFRLSLFPHGPDDGLVQCKSEMEDPLGIAWIHSLFWKTLSTQVLPTVLKMHKKFDGSDMDRDLNSTGPQGKAVQAFFAGLQKRTEMFLDQRSTKPSGSRH